MVVGQENGTLASYPLPLPSYLPDGTCSSPVLAQGVFHWKTTVSRFRPHRHSMTAFASAVRKRGHGEAPGEEQIWAEVVGVCTGLGH